MNYFEKYVSNTYAGSSNQLYFHMDKSEIKTGRALYKIDSGGKYNYSFLFSNVIDSTYADGSISQKNLMCDSWKILSARVGKVCSYNFSAEALPEIKWLSDLLFDKLKSKHVEAGEFFFSDPVELEFENNEYLCLELTFTGTMIPCHEESLIPTFVNTGNEWKYSKQMPLPSMIGCDRNVKSKMAYLGDSITQGIGTEINSYSHWNAILSEKLGEEYSYWNLGIGHGRASDAASDGAWIYKAKQNDIVFVCFGVNDILHGHSENQIKCDLERIVDLLKNCGIKVVLQTIPPFEFNKTEIRKWKNINEYIKNTLSKKADLFFDNTLILSENGIFPKYGGHPNKDGCKIWADELYYKLNTKI